ncbi:hypothetical protein [Thauera sp.]|uniref:hypothetical protein n=1 Tax=Thauera sp. TaxID=1905334 RepID=UPI0039E39CA3
MDAMLNLIGFLFAAVTLFVMGSVFHTAFGTGALVAAIAAVVLTALYLPGKAPRR